MATQQGTPDRPSETRAQFAPYELSALKAIPEATFALLERLCGVGLNPFRDGGEDGRRATDYACGRLSVAHMLKALRDMPVPVDPRGSPPEEKT
jgi:hypothetical protein